MKIKGGAKRTFTFPMQHLLFSPLWQFDFTIEQEIKNNSQHLLFHDLDKT